MGRPVLYDNMNETEKNATIHIKRLITAAGRIQDKIADDVASLDALKKEIKTFEIGLATTPETEVVLVSGEYVAVLTGEAAQREKGADVNRTVFGLLGMDQFLEICTLPVPATRKALGAEQYETVCPAYFNGTGRRFSLKKKS